MGSKNYTIFLVDDDELYLNTIEKSLSKRNDLVVEKFIVGEVCLQNLKRNPDIIVLDHNLDSKYYDASTGFDLLKKIKSTNPEINIIMLSGQDDLEIAVSTLQNGAVDYIVKNKSAFVRLNYSIEKIIKDVTDQKELKRYKKTTIAIAAIFISVLITILILWVYFPSPFNG